MSSTAVTEIETRRVAELVKELDGLVPAEGAAVRLEQHGGGPDECLMVANPAGYLRFGIELMKGAFAPASGDTLGESRRVEIDLADLVTEDSTVYFDWFERIEDLEHRLQFDDEQGLLERLAPLGCLLAGLAGAVLAGIGAVTVIRWLWG